jgi:hypothetical protein
LYLGFSECSGSYGFILLSRPQGIGRLRQMSMLPLYHSMIDEQEKMRQSLVVFSSFALYHFKNGECHRFH